MNRANGGGLFGIKPQALSGAPKPVRQSVIAGASLAGSAGQPAAPAAGIVKFQFSNLLARFS